MFRAPIGALTSGTEESATLGVRLCDLQLSNMYRYVDVVDPTDPVYQLADVMP